MKRPLGVTIIGVLMIVEGLPLGFLGFIELARMLRALPFTIPPEVMRQFHLVLPGGLLAAAFWGGLGLLLLLGGISTLLLRPWAWLFAMVLQGVSLANLLYGYSVGRQNYVGMVLSVVVVFYLNSRSVRLAFDLARRRTPAARPIGDPRAPRDALPAAKTPNATAKRPRFSRRRQRPLAKDASS